jgi:hypothetical protein
MHRDSGLANATLEVLNRDDTAWVVRGPVGPRPEDPTHIVQLCQRISFAPVVVIPRRLWKPTVFLGIAYCSWGSAHELRSLADRESWFAAIIRSGAPGRIP